MSEGILTKLKMIAGLEEIEEEDEIAEVPAKSRSQAAAANDFKRYQAPQYERRESSYVQPKMESHNSKVVSMQNTAARQQLKLVVSEPKNYDDCPKLVESLKNRKPVIINLENLEPEIQHRIFYFMSGATSALNGKALNITNSIFVFVPENVDLIKSSGEEKSKGQASSLSASPWRR